MFRGTFRNSGTRAQRIFGKAGDARAWPDNPLPTRSTEWERRLDEQSGTPFCTGALEVGKECLVWRLAGCCPLGLRGFVTFPAATKRSAPVTKATSPGHHILVQLYVKPVAHLAQPHAGFHEPHSARSARARTVWHETLHTRLRNRLRFQTSSISPTVLPGAQLRRIA